MNRREFVRKGFQVAAGAAALGSGVANATVPRDKKIPLAGSIPTRKFGKTGLELPILGAGGVPLVSMWRMGLPRLSEGERVELVRYAYDRGVRYFDTAPVYHECESILGRALKDVRDNVYLNTKVETTAPAEVRKSVEISLEKLQTSYLDGIQIHGTPGLENMTVKQAMKIHAELVKLRDEGIVRFIGFSAHGYFDKAYDLISTGGFDTTLLACGYFRAGMLELLPNAMVEYREMCLAKASEGGMGILAMKVLRLGMFGHWGKLLVPGFDEKRIKQLPGAAIRYQLQDERVHTLLIGLSGKSDLDENIRTLSGNTMYTTSDSVLLAEFSAKLYEHKLFQGAKDA